MKLSQALSLVTRWSANGVPEACTCMPVPGCICRCAWWRWLQHGISVDAGSGGPWGRRGRRGTAHLPHQACEFGSCTLAHTSRTRPSSARITRGSATSAPAGQHRLGHVREQDALGADAVELGLNDLPTHMESRRAVELIALHDVEVCAPTGGHQALGPFGVTGEAQHLAVDLEAQCIGGCAGAMVHLNGVTRTAPTRAACTSRASLDELEVVPARHTCGTRKQRFGRSLEAGLDAFRSGDTPSKAQCAWQRAGHGPATTRAQGSGRHAGGR